jgi:hypothetical protein
LCFFPAFFAFGRTQPGPSYSITPGRPIMWGGGCHRTESSSLIGCTVSSSRTLHGTQPTTTHTVPYLTAMDNVCVRPPNPDQRFVGCLVTIRWSSVPTVIYRIGLAQRRTAHTIYLSIIHPLRSSSSFVEISKEGKRSVLVIGKQRMVSTNCRWLRFVSLSTEKNLETAISGNDLLR